MGLQKVGHDQSDLAHTPLKYAFAFNLIDSETQLFCKIYYLTWMTFKHRSQGVPTKPFGAIKRLYVFQRITSIPELCGVLLWTFRTEYHHKIISCRNYIDTIEHCSYVTIYLPLFIPVIRSSWSEDLLEGLMLKLQYFGHLMRKACSLEKTDAGKGWGQEEKGAAEDEMIR